MLLSTSSNGTLTISPEMPDNWHGDMEWDLSDIMFMLEMEGAEKLWSNIDDVSFIFENNSYTIDIYDAQDLSVGMSVELQPYKS